MANNCLVTQLKGSVNNNSLLRLGALRFTYKANSFNNAKSQNITIGTNADYPLTMEIVGNNGYIADDYQTPTTSKKEEWNGSNRTWAVGPNSSDVVFDVYPAYNIFYIKIGGTGDGEFENHIIVNPEIISCMPRLREIDIRECHSAFVLNTSFFKGNAILATLKANSTNLNGDIANIQSTVLQVLLCASTNINGDLEQVAWLSSILELDIRNTPNLHKKRSTIDYLTNRGCSVLVTAEEVDENA